jgi:hypothetical protein
MGSTMFGKTRETFPLLSKPSSSAASFFFFLFLFLFFLFII